MDPGAQPPERPATTTYGRPVGTYRTLPDDRLVLDRGTLDPKRDRIHRLGGYSAPMTVLQELLPQGAVIFHTPTGVRWAAPAHLFIEHGLPLQSDTEYMVLPDVYWQRQAPPAESGQTTLPGAPPPPRRQKQRQVHLVTKANPLPRSWLAYTCSLCGSVFWTGHGGETSIASVLMAARRAHAGEAHGWVPIEPKKQAP